MINYLDYTYQSKKGTVQKDQVFNSALHGSFSDMDYTSAYVNGEKFIGNGSNLVFNVAWTPVDQRATSPYTGESLAPVVTVDGVVENPANYTVSATGITFAAGHAPANTKEVVIKYWYINTDVRSDGFGAFGGPNTGNQSNDGALGAAGYSNIPEIGLEMKSEPIEAKTRALRAYWSLDAQYMLTKEYGVDINDHLATQAAGEIAYEIDNEITSDLLKSAFANTNPILAPLTWSKTQQWGVSLADHYDGFVATINQGKNNIQAATRKVSATYMVCGLNVATVLSVMRNFEATTNVSPNGPYYYGTLGGMKVYVNPNYPADFYMLGYKGSNMFDAGYFYCPYMPVTSTDLLMDANFRGQRGWMTMYGKKMLNPNLYTCGQITN